MTVRRRKRKITSRHFAVIRVTGGRYQIMRGRGKSRVAVRFMYLRTFSNRATALIVAHWLKG